MHRRIVIIDGHPDAERGRLVHGLADAYADGASANGYEVRRIEVATLDFPILRTYREWTDMAPPPVIRAAQASIGWAEHLAIFYPLWLGDMPALLKAFLEQVMRPGFALRDNEAPFKAAMLKGRSAQVVVTMGMPALAYRFYFGAHSVKSLERNILKLVGIKPVRHTLIGDVEGCSDTIRTGWLQEMFGLGEAAE